MDKNKNISSDSLKLEKKASNKHITAKEQQTRDIKVFIKFINWVLNEDGIVVKDFIKDLKDGKILVQLASRLCSTKENILKPRYHKNIKDKSHLRENFEIAFNILRENDYKKETAGISAEDFEKDESGDTESIDFTSVLGFFWQLMLRYQKTHFKDYDNLPVNLHIKQGMSKYEQFLAKLETFISLQLIGKCWEINKNKENVLMEKKDNVYELSSNKCYCLVGVAMVKGEKENCEVFIRFGKDSTEEDKLEAIDFANSLIKKLGRSRVLVALVEEGFEIPEWNDYLGIVYDENIQHSLSSVDPTSYKGTSIKTDQILGENEEIVIVTEKLFSLSNSNEVILMSNESNQIDHIDFLGKWKKANNDNKPISITFCNPSVLPVRIILTLEQKKKEEEESLHEQERLEKERLEKERLEKERLEKERLEKERLEKERLEKERLEKERLEKERLEKERLEKERLEKERLEKERLEKERLEKERLEKERLEKERLEKERLEKERLEKERLEKERLEKERLEKERLEKERLEKERLEKERLEKERLEKERLEKERLEKERLEKERLEKERLEKERLEKERLEKERLEKERLEKERLEKERLEKERLEKERLEKERLEKERLEKERLEKERLEKERLEKERLEKERLEKERLEKERLEKERLEKERLEKERLEKEILEKERLEKERLEKERIEKERLEKERLEKERLEKERLEKERLEKERLEKERLEKERLEKERLEKERLEKERLEKERLEREEREEILFDNKKVFANKFEEDKKGKEIFEKLKKAIKENDLPLFKQILQQADEEKIEAKRYLDLMDENNMGLLHLCAFHNRNLIATELINKGADVDLLDDTNQTPLYVAASRNSQETLDVLLNSKKCNLALADLEENTALHVATNLGFENLVKSLLSAGANPNQPNSKGDTPVHVACFANHSSILSLFTQPHLPTKSDLSALNHKNQVPLHFAVEKGNLKSVQLLVENGSVVDCVDLDDKTPMWFACEKGNYDVEVYLRKAGCNLLWSNNEGETYLHVSALNGHLPIVKDLVNEGKLKKNLRTFKKKETPIFYAARNGHIEVIKFLLEEDDINVKNDDDENFVDVARRFGHGDLINQLDLNRARSKYWLFPWLLLGITVFTIYRVTTKKKDK